MLDTEGQDLEDSELLDLISESCTMSKSLEEYEGRKSCATTTAKRLAAFLGDARVKDKGLKAEYIIAKARDRMQRDDAEVEYINRKGTANMSLSCSTPRVCPRRSAASPSSSSPHSPTWQGPTSRDGARPLCQGQACRIPGDSML